MPTSPSDEFFDAALLPDAVEPVEVAAPKTAATQPVPVATLATVPRDPKFTVILDERLPRQDTVLMQVSVPADIHQRLKYDSIGSMNHVLMGLVRYALTKLDEDQLTLRIERRTTDS